ncbi:hypothetical protein GCM10007423_28650 [Dyadobacter endophyticus]|uniref:Uncharacterized protein n=1 Tax=Dyadobacter endophyticus TaxID=1749036 RepID=A0ABQ1YRT3_9BACT|nr:hypothetical protein [Dyadobacter endophyticus]GGH36368.1 hypothetical protein GCM10007423_28650 [Dyadobacter endophyticus]
MTELNVNRKGNVPENWITDEELRQRYPKLWKAAKEKVNRIGATSTPELREQLRRLRGR